LKVGIVFCKVRFAKTKLRCFKCLVFGHESKMCKGPNRERCCRKCGNEGHFAINCNANREDVISFRTKLTNDSKNQVESGEYNERPTRSCDEVQVEATSQVKQPI